MERRGFLKSLGGLAAAFSVPSLSHAKGPEPLTLDNDPQRVRPGDLLQREHIVDRPRYPVRLQYQGPDYSTGNYRGRSLVAPNYPTGQSPAPTPWRP